MTDGPAPDRKQKLEALLQRLEKEREELRVKLNLAKLEARDEWEEVGEKLDRLRGRMKVLGEEARDASGDVGEAAELLADEVKEGIARLRKLL